MAVTVASFGTLTANESVRALVCGQPKGLNPRLSGAAHAFEVCSCWSGWGYRVVHARSRPYAGGVRPGLAAARERRRTAMNETETETGPEPWLVASWG
jgi:hypothetical protein